MALPRKFVSGRIRSQRRKTSWTFGPATGTDGSIQQISTPGKLGATTAIVSLEDGQTLVRTRGEVLLTLISAAAVGNGFHGAFGLCVVSSQASSIGETAVPGPITEEDWDGWFYHRYFSLFSTSIIDQSAADADDFMNVVTATLRLELDSKAMRKWEANMNVVAILEVLEVGTAVMNWNLNSRILVKLA